MFPSDPELQRYFPHLFAAWASMGAWKCYSYLVHISRAIREAMHEPDGGRLIINVPPRHGKSEFIHFWLPIWYLDTWPSETVVTASHTARLSAKFGRAIRNQFSHNRLLSTRLAADSQAANQFHTDAGGGLVTGGVDTGLTGFGANLAICDDPYKNPTDAASDSYQSKLRDWWNSVFMTRLEPNATVIVMHHRWRPDDLTGYLLEESEDRERWKCVSLPALAEPSDPLGRAEGEALCPERFDRASLLLKRRSVGLEAWQSMYQQAPKFAGTDSAYPRFAQENISAAVAVRPDLPWQVSFDFNIAPGMHAVIGQYDRKKDELTALDEVYEDRMRVEESVKAAAQKIRALHRGAGDPEIHIFGDPSGAAESVRSEGSAYDEIVATFRALGLRKLAVRTTPAAPPVVDRIRAMNDALRDADGRRHYYVHPRCVGLIEDFRKTKIDKSGHLMKGNERRTHFTDCEGYRVDYQRPVGLSQAVGRKPGS